LLYSGCFDHQARITNLHLIFGFANRYGFKVETIFLAFSLYHRVAFAPEFAKHSLTLQAVASLFVAAKYEEIAIPKVEVFARCDPRIDPNDVLKVESEILLHLNFNLSFPNVLQFIDLLRVRYNLDRPVRDKLISICYKSLNSLALWQERGSLLAMACLYVLQPELELGQSRSQELLAELKWRVAELAKVGVATGAALA
jgi:hypothetical protein